MINRGLEVFVFMLMPIILLAQNDNILKNQGEICTVVYGSGTDNITVNNNFQYYFPEKEIIEINQQLKEILKKNGIITEEKRIAIEKELNVTRKIKELEKKINNYERVFNELSSIVSKDTLSVLVDEQVLSIQQLITLGTTATQNTKCLYEDYKFETYEDEYGDIYHRIEKNKIDGDPNFIIVYPFSDGLAKIKQYNKYGYINEKGDKIIPAKYDYGDNFQDGFAIVGKKEYGERMKYFFMYEDNVEIGGDYIEIKRIANGLFWVKNSKHEEYLLNQNREIITTSKSKKLSIDKNGYWIQEIRKMENKKYKKFKGLISPEGKTILSPKYLEIKEISDGFRAIQCANGSWGYLNENNKIYLDCYFSLAEDFDNDRAIVKVFKGMYGDSLGNEYIVEKYGVINKDGAEVIPTVWDTISHHNHRAFIVKLKNREFELNEYGVCTEGKKKRREFKEFYSTIKTDR